MYFFDGVDDRIEYPSAMLTPIINGFSAAAWVDLDNVADVASDSRIVCSLTVNAAVTTGDHNFRFQVGDHGNADDTRLVFTTQVATVGTTATGTAHLPLGGLHHVAFTYDGANVRFYIDGMLDATVAYTTDCGLSGTHRFQIGSGYDNPAIRLMQGYIAEVAYWDRVVTDYEIGQIGIREVGRSPLAAAPTNLKFYATLFHDDANFGGSAASARNLIEGTSGTITGAARALLRMPAPNWKHLLVRSSPADGMIKYTGGTYDQARAGTSTGTIGDRGGGNGSLPQAQGMTHIPFGQAPSQVYQNYFAFDFHKVLPPDAFVGNAGFCMRNGIDNTATVTNVCELREYDFGAVLGASGSLELADYIVCDNLSNYTLLGTKTSAPAGRFTANSDVHFDPVIPAIRDAIRRDRFTQVSLTTDRMRNANIPADDETIHPMFSETVQTVNVTYMWVMYYREGQFDRRTFPNPRLRKALA